MIYVWVVNMWLVVVVVVVCREFEGMFILSEWMNGLYMSCFLMCECVCGL